MVFVGGPSYQTAHKFTTLGQSVIWWHPHKKTNLTLGALENLRTRMEALHERPKINELFSYPYKIKWVWCFGNCPRCDGINETMEEMSLWKSALCCIEYVYLTAEVSSKWFDHATLVTILMSNQQRKKLLSGMKSYFSIYLLNGIFVLKLLTWKPREDVELTFFDHVHSVRGWLLNNNSGPQKYMQPEYQWILTHFFNILLLHKIEPDSQRSPKEMTLIWHRLRDLSSVYKLLKRSVALLLNC